MADTVEEQKHLVLKIAKIFDEASASHASHNRKLRELHAVRSSSSSLSQFFSAFSKTLTPLFDFQRRTPSADRIVRFVSVFSTARDSKTSSDSDKFLERFLKFLTVAASAANKNARSRSCQIASEIVMRLPDDVEVSDDTWEEVIECMKLRVGDKIPSVRTFAVRALSRFVNESENSDILDLLLEVLPLEKNCEVRKTIVLSLPPSNATSQAIIDCTLDVNESVRRAAFCVLANKFPIQSLSIKMRTTILRRGLSDRSVTVSRECLKLMKDEWLLKCCDGDPVQLLKYLDVETYEAVAESVMEALLKEDLVKLKNDQSIRQYITPSNGTDGNSKLCMENFQLMEAEVALFWRITCKYLQSEAQAKGSDAATTTGTAAAVYAAEASDKNDLLERILPAMVSDYIKLVKAHIDAGPNHRFASRQLLLLAAMLDYSDTTNRKVAGTFLQELLHNPLESEQYNDGNMVVLGDGLSLGGDRDWAIAVSKLARKVHTAPGEFEEVILKVLEELAQPCRERTANFVHWMHCLAVTSLLLENAKSFHWLRGKAIEPHELLISLLLPAAKHVNFDVQRISIRCLGLFGLLERKPRGEVVRQLRHSFIRGPNPISIVACKALFDLLMWHGPQEVDTALGKDFSSPQQEDKKQFSPVLLTDLEEDVKIETLDLLYGGFGKDDWGNSLNGEDESVHAVLGEGFAKILLLSKNYPSIPISLQPLLISKLVILYFSNATENLQRLKQCLSVFFDLYPSLSANHKKSLCKAFIPVMRSMWPGINGNARGSTFMVSNMRKCAVQASHFMLQMLRAPLYTKENEQEDGNSIQESPEVNDAAVELPFEYNEEGLAIYIAREVLTLPKKKTAAEKSYVASLCKTLGLLHFRSSEQGPIKFLRRVINSVIESVLFEKDVVKDLKKMGEHLDALEKEPELPWSQDQANIILGKLELDFNMDLDNLAAIPQTPAPCSTRAPRSRRRVRLEQSSSEEDVSPTSVVPMVQNTANQRSQRASKTAALAKMSASRIVNMNAVEDEREEDSEVTTEDESDTSVEYN